MAGADQTDKMVALGLLPVIQPFIFRVLKIRLMFFNFTKVQTQGKKLWRLCGRAIITHGNERMRMKDCPGLKLE